MDLAQIEALAKLIRQSDLTALEISEGNTRIRLERSVSATAPSTMPLVAVPAVPEVTAVSIPETVQSEHSSTVDFNNMNEVKSPMVGVFYAAPSPGAQPYVSIGSKVKAGDVLCIVEAMKLMNEIVAEQDGEIVDICAQDGQIVEYGQTLFKIF